MTEALLLSLIAGPCRDARKNGVGPVAIGVQSETRWQGPEEITVDEEQLRVWQCDSVLEARELLAEHLGERMVLVTHLGLKELGADVEARFLRHRLFQVEAWDLLRTRFNARSFDSSLNGKAALARAAVEALGASSPDPAPAGVLTAEAAWKVVLDRKLGIAEARPDVRALLEWALNAESAARWKAFPPELKSLLESWIKAYLGDWVDPFWGCLDAGYGQSAMAIGFVLDVLRQQPNDPQERVSLAQALGRLERFVGGKALSARAQQVWADASAQWAGAVSQPGRFGDVAPVLTNAEALLDGVGAGNQCDLSRWLPRGFNVRLLAAARATSEAPASVEETLRYLEDHYIWQWSRTEADLMDRARMAARLARWLVTSVQENTEWPAPVSNYQRSGAWVDVARQTLLTGDGPEPVLKSWLVLLDRVKVRRERENTLFAQCLAIATQRNSTADAGVPVEQVLERIVAPWGKERVLFIVMDGMSIAVWRELQREVEGRTWLSWSWNEGAPLPPAIAALPSVTTVSRCSLLSGRLAVGGQDAEKRGFSENPALAAVSKGSHPPVLFHKDEVGAGASNLSDSVRKEIRSDQRRVVGVVLNVIDDSLGGPDQRVFRWGVDQIPILRTLLSEAETSGRAVILTSDHGHVLDRGAVLRRQGGSDRYRVADGTPVAPDEVLVEGTRVLEAGGRVVALATEGVRYSAARKLGYHGGVTPQECLIPLAVLATENRGPEGWFPVAEEHPVWWYPESAQPTVPSVQKSRKTRARAEGPLLEGLIVSEPDWIRDFAAGELLAEQLRIAGGRLEISKVEIAVRALVSRNGVMMKPAFAQSMEIPLFRVDGLLSNLQRVVNVDGYPVLSVDSSQTVRLDISLLKTQFGLPTGA